MSLAGKLALVTGGGHGIGRAICQILAREGADVVTLALHQEGLDETLASLPKGNHQGYVCDVSSSEEIAKFFAQLKQSYGDRVPSIVVCNAGVNFQLGVGIVDWTEESWNRMFNINLKGYFLVMKEAAKLMMTANIKDGSVITLTGVLKDGCAGGAAYAATKAAIESLTRSAAAEWAHIPIRCNAVNAGPTDTPMLNGNCSAEVKEMLKNTTLLKRIANAREIAEIIPFLASDKASYVTGAIFDVTGGWKLT